MAIVTATRDRRTPATAARDIPTLAGLAGHIDEGAHPYPVAQPLPAMGHIDEGRRMNALGPTGNPILSPAATQYDQRYQSSLTDARSAIEAQVRNALGEVGRSEAAQRAAIGALPGQSNQLYDLATQQAQGFASGADATVQKAGINGAPSAMAGVSPVLSAMAMARATQQGGVPLLGLAASDNAARQRGGIQQTGLAALADLGTEERGYLSQLGTEQRKTSENYAREDFLRAEQYKREDQVRKEERQHELDLKSLATQEKQAGFGTMEVSPDRGAALALTEQAKLRGDSAYQLLVSKLKKSPPVDKTDMYALTDAFKKQYPKASTPAMSLALFDLYGGK